MFFWIKTLHSLALPNCDSVHVEVVPGTGRIDAMNVPGGNSVEDFFHQNTGQVKGIASESILRLSHERGGRL